MRHSIYNTDEKIIEGVLQGKPEALNVLYKLYFPVIHKFILNNNGTDEEAKDVYQEGIIAVYQNIQKGTFKQESKLKTYLYSICRRIWLTELKKKGNFTGKIQDYENKLEVPPEVEAEMNDNHEEYKLMNNCLAQLGEPCQTILHDFYISRLSMQDIADKMNYTNMENAKTQKYKCLQRLKKLYFSTIETKEKGTWRSQ